MQSESFDHLHLVDASYNQLRRYAARLLDTFAFRAAPVAQPALNAFDRLKDMNQRNAPTMASDAPTGFIKPRWEQHVLTDNGINRHFYELCAMSELKNALRSGDIWIPGSRQFKDLEEYLLPPAHFTELREAGELPLAIDTDGERYVRERLARPKEKLQELNRCAAAGELPDAEIADELLRIKSLAKSVPEEAGQLEEDLFDIIAGC